MCLVMALFFRKYYIQFLKMVIWGMMNSEIGAEEHFHVFMS